MNLHDFKWSNDPQAFELTADCKLHVRTKPNTDYWQKNAICECTPSNNGHAFLKVVEEDFTLSVKVDFDYKQVYDQCGLMIYKDIDNWYKASIEYETDKIHRLGSVLATNGYSDWACTDFSSDYKSIYYRLTRKGSDFRMESSVDGEKYMLMRTFHLFGSENAVQVGVYACSPKDSSFDCIFSEWNLEKHVSK